VELSVSAAHRLKFNTTDMKSVVWAKLKHQIRLKLENHGYKTPWYLVVIVFELQESVYVNDATLP